MKDVRFSTKVKKDRKRYRHDLVKLSALYEVLEHLAKDEKLDEKNRAHTLIGNYKKCIECHIGNDILYGLKMMRFLWSESEAILNYLTFEPG